MRETLNRHRFEVLLALAVAAVFYYGAQGLLAMWEARASYQDAIETRNEIEAEAALFDIAALTSERDRLAAEAGSDAFPTRDEVEAHIGTIAGLFEDPFIELGPVVIGELSDEVTDADVGAPGSGSRTYRGTEMSLTLGGDVVDLLNLADRLLAAVPDATVQDVGLTLGTPPDPSSLSLRVLLYHGDR